MAKDQDIWLYRYSVSPATFFITASLLFCCWGRRLHLWPKWLHTELTQDQFTKKIWCLKSICCAQTEFTPSFKVGWVFKFLLMDLSLSGVCRNSFVRKSEGKKIHPWATNPLGVILLIARERKKKVTGLENNKILSVFGSDSGKLQTDAVVCFLLMAVWRILRV